MIPRSAAARSSGPRSASAPHSAVATRIGKREKRAGGVAHHVLTTMKTSPDHGNEQERRVGGSASKAARPLDFFHRGRSLS